MTFTWTPETVERCSELYAQGQHSAAQIAVIIGTSKGSVIGKMDRLGVRSPRTKADNTPPTPVCERRLEALREQKRLANELAREEVRKRGVTVHPRIEAAQKPAQPVAVVLATPTPETPVLRLVSHGKTLLHLSARECRYAVGTSDAGEHTFCAAPTPVGSSWCPACRALVYAPANYKTRIGHTAGRRFA